MRGNWTKSRSFACAVMALAVAHCGGRGSSGHGSERATTIPAATDEGAAARPDSACPPLADAAHDIYVDGRAPEGVGSGTRGCPLHSIAKALELLAKRTDAATVHVAEGEYNETTALNIRGGVTVTGAGAAKVILHAGGACPEGSMACGVFVGGGGNLEGVTVTNAHGVAVVTATHGIAMLQDVRATSSSEAGVLVRGAAELKDLVCDHNKGDGLRIDAPTVSTVKIGGSNVGMSHFDRNERNGIQVLGRGVLEIAAGSASSNDQHGIRIATDGEIAGRPHTLVGLDANQNAEDGVQSSGASLKVRASVALKNGGSGLVFFARGLADARLDLGTASDPGLNSFSAGRRDALNGRAGICLDLAAGTPVVQAVGDRWAACPIKQMMIEGECDGTYGSVDVAFHARAGASMLPVSAGACEVCR